ncbi:MAG TPA: hypothetical protein VMY99_05050 [Nevskiaceae bacterium]|nr:hypothetical protein [Nevskiaceae bacterium]
MIFELFRWWYGPGWVLAMRRCVTWVASVERSFSLLILLRTLFAPWRRILTPRGRSLDAKIQALLDNFVSRIIGSVVRSGVIIAAAVSITGVFLFGVVCAAVWPLLPAVIVYGIVRSIIG